MKDDKTLQLNELNILLFYPERYCQCASFDALLNFLANKMNNNGLFLQLFHYHSCIQIIILLRIMFKNTIIMSIHFSWEMAFDNFRLN